MWKKRMVDLKTISLFFLFGFTLTAYSVEPHEYEVHLMWVNRTVEKENKFVFPTVDRNQKNIFESVSGWRASNENVYFWYDSQFSTPDQIHETQLLFEEKIHLLDIRKLKFFNSPEPSEEIISCARLFSEETSLFFRVDLLRLMVTLERLASDKTPPTYIVYADVDVAPMNKDELFDSQTMGYLEKFGMVVSRGPEGCPLNIENGFHIVKGLHREAMNAIQATIEINLIRGRSALSGKLKTSEKNQLETLPSIVYESYPDLFTLLYHQLGFGSLQFIALNSNGDPDTGELETYDQSKHGLEIVGVPRNLAVAARFTAFPPNIVYSRFDWPQFFFTSKIEGNFFQRVLMLGWAPTKAIKVPPARHDYY